MTCATHRTALLLSGGVDSSVALHRLLASGEHDVTAFYLKIWLEDELSYLGDCPWQDDLEHARAVCQQAGVELRVVSLQRQYHERVVSWALGELRAGRTPSPDVLCNRTVKFGAFLDLLADPEQMAGTEDQMEDHGFDFVASGHYARLERLGDGVRLLRGVDPVKDQTYFLFQLDQQQLRRALFPIGDLTKPEVRALAARLGLPNRLRKDSQGLCFLGKIPFAGFVEAHLGERPGPIRRVGDGAVVGRHRGHWFHTVGQRKGLGLHGGPWYVVAKDLAAPGDANPDGVEDVLWICHHEELASHARSSFRLAAPHWIADPPKPGTVAARVRHGQSLQPATLSRQDGDEDGWYVELRSADPGLAPGQVAVLYRGEECLGGGTIEWPGQGANS